MNANRLKAAFQAAEKLGEGPVDPRAWVRVMQSVSKKDTQTPKVRNRVPGGRDGRQLRRLLQQHIPRMVVPDDELFPARPFTWLIQELGEHRWASEAVGVAQAMEKAGVAVDQLAHTTLIKAVLKCGRLDLALGVLVRFAEQTGSVDELAAARVLEEARRRSKPDIEAELLRMAPGLQQDWAQQWVAWSSHVHPRPKPRGARRHAQKLADQIDAKHPELNPTD